MIYLLLSALILGVTASQPANSTDQKLDKILRNQMFSMLTNSTTNPNNVKSFLTEDEMTELQRNTTFTVITEDDENFQEEDIMFPHEHCNRNVLIEFSHNYCGRTFQTEMEGIRTEDWCVLEAVIRPYNTLTSCVETLTRQVGCFFPNPDNQDFFIYIHSKYFRNCTEETEVLLEDASTSLVVALTIIPISFIPILVYLVVWKS